MRPLIVFAHGAGAGSSSPWMRGWSDRLEALGDVVTFDYPYVRDGRRRPDPLPKLITAHREVLAEARRGRSGRVVLAGKSMGSRVGCHVATEESVDALVCLGYPLVSPGKRRNVRDEVLLALRSPVLFVQGTRDRLCPLDELERVRARMTAPSELYIVQDGDHSLQITKRRQKEEGITQQHEDTRILAAIDTFLTWGRARS